MKLSTISAAFAAAVTHFHLVQGHVTSNHILHEKREVTPHGWVKVGKASQSATLDLQIGLTQQNLHLGEQFLNAAAHPQSETYGQHWSPQKVVDTFAPSEKTISEAFKWLQENGITGTQLSGGRNWLKVKTTVAKAEKLLHTTYYKYRYSQNGVDEETIACDSYSLPQNLKEHVDMIIPTIDLKNIDKPPSHPVRRRKERKFNSRSIRPDSITKLAGTNKCADQTTPACIRKLYNMPETGEAVKNNSLGVVLYSPETFSQKDLDRFFAAHAPNVPAGTGPDIHKIDGGFRSNGTSPGDVGEGNLDLSYTISLTHPLKVTLFQTGDSDGSARATDNNFLDAIDGSYCTFEGGDDKDWDAIYPHNEQWAGPGTYRGQPNCGTETPTHVISVSYGSNEGDRPLKYRTRQCTEFMKLGLMGVTVMYASGDTGVAGLRGRCRTPDGGWTDPGADHGRFNPGWPAACPWITTVGGTGLPINGTIHDKEVVAHTFSPGGGFSDLFAIPDYQKTAVAHYYAKHAPAYDSTRYNNSQQVRGYPDVALASQEFVIGLEDDLRAFSGTSASTPTFAAMIALINGERLKIGKKPVGFINPALYSHAKIFNDVVSGSNGGCGTEGFHAVEGWDPASGLGTPDYPKLKNMFLSLP